MKKFKVIFAYIAVCFVWGTTWYGIKLSVETIPPMTAAGLRFIGSFPLLFIVISFLPNVKAKYPPGKNKIFWLVSLIYIAVPYALINYGETKISSGFTALIFASVSIFTVIFARLLLARKITGWQWGSVIVGFLLLAGLVLEQMGGIQTENITAPVAILSAAILHALVYSLIRRDGSDINIFTLETMPFLVGGLILFFMGVLFENPDFSAISTRSLGGLLYLVTIPSVLGFGTYFYLLQRVSPVILSYVFIFFPAVAVGFSTLLEGERFSTVSFLLMAGMLGCFASTKFFEPKTEHDG